MTTQIRQAVVLAGGFGTRLGSRTAQTPKPLLPVGDRPFLEWVIAHLGQHGVEEVILTIGYRAEAFEDRIAARSGAVAVRTFVEDEPLGTGGALPRLLDRLQDAFFVLNGDTLFDVPFQELGRLVSGSEGLSPPSGARAPSTPAGPLGAVAVRSVRETSRYGRVTLDGDRVTAFAEKETAGPGLVNGGVYAFRRAAIDRLGSPASLEEDLLPALAAEGRLAGLPVDGFFIDIGVPSAYEEAQSTVPAWWEGRDSEAY